MPLVRIDMLEGQYDEAQRRSLGDVVAEALKGVGAPDGDRFQVTTEHPSGSLAFGRDYLGIERTDGFVVIQITMNAGRTLEQKRGLYAAIANGAHEKAGARPEDVFISLVEMPKENWSFGNGEAQYAPTG